MLITSYAPFLTLQEKKMPFYVATIDRVSNQTVVHRPLGIEHHQFLYTVGGCGTAFLDGRTYELKKGMMLYLPPNTAHEYHCDTGIWETIYITFGGSGLVAFWDFEPSVWAEFKSFDFESRYDVLYSYKHRPEAVKELSVALYSMLLELKDSVEGISPSAREKKHIMTRAMHELAESDEPSLERIASRIGISEAHFCRMFKEYTGFRPFEYMNLLKLQKAKELLKNTEMSISEISQSVGYESHSYFSMLFKRYMGVTPTEYRR